MYAFSRISAKIALVFCGVAGVFTAMSMTSYQEAYLKGLSSRINPASFRDLLSFQYLYPQRPLVHEACEHLDQMFEGKEATSLKRQVLSLLLDVPGAQEKALSPDTLAWIKVLSEQKLQPRSSYLFANTLDELKNIDPGRWDIAQVAWLCSAYPKACLGSEQEMQQYLAQVDLLALSVLFAVEQEPLDKRSLALTKIEKLNQIIFQEQGFEFPPLLDHESQIDTYTSVPSMLSSKKGVCLGASVLYLAIAQRLGLRLDIVTPPGHIYLSLPLENEARRNIETTASGMHLPEDIYRPLQANRLVARSLQELPGLILMNSASVLLSRQKFSQAAQIYDKALEFLSKKNSFFINEFNMACKWLGNYPGALQYAQKLLDEYQKSPADALITWDPLLLEEISKGIIGKEPVRLLLSSSTDTPSDQKKLYQALAKQQSQYPGSKWIKSQMAIVAWKLGQEAKAFFLWPFGASSHPPFLWMGAQLSLQVGQLDTAMLCMAELKEVLPAQDTAAMTPFTRVYIELCQEAVLKKN